MADGPEASIALHSDVGAPLPLRLLWLKGREATFRLAMISTGNRLKPRTRRNLLSQQLSDAQEMENGAPANYSGEPHPPPCSVRGAGGTERSHGRKLKHNCSMLYIAAYNGDRSELLTQQDRDCQHTVQINRDLRPTARIVLQRRTYGRLRFQPSRPAPS